MIARISAKYITFCVRCAALACALGAGPPVLFDLGFHVRQPGDHPAVSIEVEHREQAEAADTC
jgi:hypothetical protein